MAFNLQEYILFRLEVQRELFNGEVDTNFKMVANPWVAYRVYEEGNIVYHPVEIEPEVSGSTGQPEQHLAWWRANRRTTLGVFLTSEWDLIGGIGAGDITIQGADSFGKFLINSTVPAVFNGTSDVLIESQTPNDTLKLVAGPGISLLHDVATQSVRIDNLGATGEVNNGVNIGLGPHEDVYDGMVGTDLSFKGFTAANTGSTILSVSSTVNNNIEYQVDEGAIDLANLNAGSPTMDMLSDVSYSGLANGDLLQWVSGSGEWQPVPSGSIGSSLFDTDSGVGSTHRIGNPAAVGNYSTISGGQSNQTPSDCATVSGGSTNCAGGVSSVVGGGKENCAIAQASTIAGGCTNSNSGDYGSIGGGLSNEITSSGDCAAIGGGQFNCATAANTTVSGGCDNRATGTAATIGGGEGNRTPNTYSTVGGGYQNQAASDRATVGGGFRNCVTSTSSTGTISGGCCNRLISSVASFIGGGQYNFSCECNSVIGGGTCNNANGKWSSIAGGFSNTISGLCSTIGGGACNAVTSNRSTVSGGYLNCTTNQFSTVAGGCRNEASSYSGFVGGGACNTTGGTACFAAIGGGFNNNISVDGIHASISGGCSGTVTGRYSSISGGQTNTVSGSRSFIGAGCENCVTGNYASVIAGHRNCNSASCGMIGGGQDNYIDPTSFRSFISGGFCNVISCGPVSAILGGSYNQINNNGSVITGGRCNIANGVSNTISGCCNQIDAWRSVISGGSCNYIQDYVQCVDGVYILTEHSTTFGSAIGGGRSNCILFDDLPTGWVNPSGGPAGRGSSTIAGGRFNTTYSGYYGAQFIGGGSQNTACCDWTVIGGGRGNTVDADFSTVAGGINNTASGCYSSILGGRSNTVTHQDATAIGSNLTSVCNCTTHINCLNMVCNQMCFFCGNGPASAVLPQGQVYMSTECGAPFLTIVY